MPAENVEGTTPAGTEAPQGGAEGAKAPEGNAAAEENKTPEGGEAEKSKDSKEPEAGKEEKSEDKKDEETLLSGEAEDDKDEKDKKEDGENEEDPVPEKYEFTAPEGVELDTGLLGKFENVARELGIGNKAAQKIMDVAALHSKEMMEAQQAKDAEIIAGFKKEIKEDPNSKQLIVDAQTAIKHFGADNEAFQGLTKQWVGNHPGLIRFLAKVGNQLREADLIDGAAAGGDGKPKSRGEILYPGMSKK